MSRPKRLSLFVVGLAALGLAVGLATATVVAVPLQLPAPGAAAEPSAPTVLLLTDGRVIQGEVLETSDGYEVKMPIGRMPFRRRDVLQTFPSIRALYEHKRARTPAHDPDELMKLVQWCIVNAQYDPSLRDEALGHIATILELSPGLKQAEAMRFQLETARHATPPMDRGLVRTSVDQAEPATLSSRRLSEIREAARQSPLAIGSPLIPGMPQQQTVKRYKEFKEFVHRAIQQKCARCHGEDSNNRFQLIQAQVRRDLDNEHLVRANFDAVIQLVNPQEPIQSELLTRSISPHPPDNRPVLSGPNDPVYRMLHYWVHGLECPTAQIPGRDGYPPAIPTGVANAAPGGSAGGFASDRAATPSLTPTPPSLAPSALPATMIQAPHLEVLPDGRTAILEAYPAGQVLPGTAPVGPLNPPPPSEFPTSPLLGAPNPATIPVRGAAAPPAPPSGAPGGTPEQPTIYVEGLGDIPVVDTRTLPATPGASPKTAVEKPPTIDKDALQRFMTGQKPPG